MLVFYPFSDRNEQSYGCLRTVHFQSFTYDFNDFIIGATRKEIMRLHRLYNLVDLLQLVDVFFLEVDRISAVDNTVDGIFEIDEQVFLCVLTEHHILDHIMVQHPPAQPSVHLHQLTNHLLLHHINECLVIQQRCLREIEI